MAEKIFTDLGNGMVRVESTFNDGERKNIPYSFELPKDGASFRAWVNSLVDVPDENADNHGKYGTLQYALARYTYGHDTVVKAAMREQSAPETTIIKVDGNELDLMTLPLAKLVKVVNGSYAVATLNPRGMGAYLTARKRLLTDDKYKGKVVEKDDMLVIVNGEAKK